ncbi:alpha/beta hydrolase [Lachnospiraceae bacterium ZAX-1]
MAWYLNVLIIALGIMVLYFVAVFILTFILVNMLVHPAPPDRKKSYEEVVAWVNENAEIDFSVYNNVEKEAFEIKRDGIRISCEYIPAISIQDVTLKKRCAILVHGYSQNRMAAAPFVEIYRDLGYEIILYDQRAFGASTGTVCTFGEKEKDDLSLIIDWAYKKLGEDTQITLHGCSMGAITVLETAYSDGRISNVIADCAPEDMRSYIGVTANTMLHLPQRLVRVYAGWCGKLVGVNVTSVSPLHHIKSIKVPILFIHGEADTNVPVQMSKSMYDEGDKSKNVLALFPEADHVMSYLNDPERYRHIVLEFLGEMGS